MPALDSVPVDAEWLALMRSVVDCVKALRDPGDATGEVRRIDRHPAGGQGLERLTHLLMEPHAPREPHPVVQGATHERVPEPVAPDRLGGEQPRRDRGIQPVEELRRVQAGGLLQDVEREALPDGGGDLEQFAGRCRQTVEAASQDVTHAVGHGHGLGIRQQ